MSELMMMCPECNAVFTLHGDFANNEGQIKRMGFTAAEDCSKCEQIAKVCGFGEVRD
jgi:hypothetical protein